MSITIQFTPWGVFWARKRDAEIHRWLKSVADNSAKIFRSSMGASPSADFDWPGVRTGRLRSSVSSYATHNEAVVGSNMRYSIYLRTGTTKMARRKMSDNALKEGMHSAQLGRWVEWSR